MKALALVRYSRRRGLIAGRIHRNDSAASVAFFLMLEQMTQPRLRVHLIMDSGSSRTVVAASGVAGSSAESAYEQADDGVCRSEPVSSRTGEVGSDLGQSS